MFELLEDLEGKFKDRFKKQVNMTEITRYALQLNEATWLIVTNQKLYLLQKKLFFITSWIQKLADIEEVASDGEIFKIKAKNGSRQVKVLPVKKNQAKKLAGEIEKII